MKELITILKYGLKGSGIFSRSKQARWIFSFITPLIFIFIFGIPMYYVLKESSFYILNVSSVDFLEFIAVSWCFFLMVISITTLFPFIVYSLIKNEEIEMLLSLPINRGSIIIYQTVLTLMSESFLIVFFLFGFLAYTNVMGFNKILSIVASLIYILFLISISMLLAIAFGKLLGKHRARKYHTIMYFVNISLFVLLSQMNPSVLKNMNLENMMKRLEFMKKFILNPMNPAYLPILSVKHVEILLIMIFSVIILFVLVYRLSKNVTFEMVYDKRKKHKIIFPTKAYGTVSGVFLKDIKTFSRNEQMIFMIFYSIGFPLIFAFLSKNFSLSFPLVVFISGIYIALTSAFLTSQEFLVLPMSKSFPIKLESLFLPKLIIPALVYTTTCTIFVVIYVSLTNNFFMFLTIPFTFLLYLFNSYLGILFYLKKPVVGTKKYIHGGRIYVIEALTLLVGLTTSIAVYLYVSRQNLLIKLLGGKFFAILVGIVLPIATSLYLIFCIIKGMKKISDIFSRIN